MMSDESPFGLWLYLATSNKVKYLKPKGKVLYGVKYLGDLGKLGIP